jgi:urate oxidase
MSSVTLKAACYGKDKVRVLKVYRDGKKQTAVELTCRLTLEGDIETSFTKADNSVVVTTDTCKNTIYIMAKRSANVDNIEVFAQEITEHVLRQYKHIHVAHVDIIKHKWSRMTVDGEEHPHSFVRDGEEVQTTKVSHYRQGDKVEIVSGLKGLLVLKTTGSAFHGFYKDEYTTLPEVWDRIFSTAVDCTWTFESASASALRQLNFPEIHQNVKKITQDTFAKDDSASVQATMYKMQKAILDQHEAVAEVSYVLPNKHYFGVDMSKFNIDNTDSNLDVYQPVSDPSGLITATVARKSRSRL